MPRDLTAPATAEDIKRAEALVKADEWDGYANVLAENGQFTNQWLQYRAMAAKARGFTLTAEMAAAEMVAHGAIKP